MKNFDPRSGIGSADINTFDFTRCERPDGTAYGTSGKCRQGTERSKAAIEKDISATIQQMKGVKGLEAYKLKQKLAELKAERREPGKAKGPQGQKNVGMANEIIKDSAARGRKNGVDAGLDLLKEANRSMNKEIRNAQTRARQLQAAGARLHNVEMDLRNKTNKMDKGFEKDDPKVRERLTKVQAAQERVKKMQDQNIRFRQKLEGPLRSSLTKANDDLERLASEIRRNEGPARAQQMDNLRAKVKEIQTLRKRLNEGPGFAPDLGGKGGEPLNVSKIYDQADID